MKRFFLQGTGLLTALALLCFLAPVSPARANSLESTEPEPAVDMEMLPAEEPSEPVEVIITPFGDYNEGRIRVTDGTLWGYAVADGSVVIQPQFDQAADFSLGAALVTQNGKIGLLRWDGVFLLEPIYDELADVGYGLYLGKQGEAWDLLSVTTVKGSSHQVETGLTSAFLTPESLTQQLVLRRQDGSVQRVLVNSLPQFLKEHKVPGWQFPLSSKQAAFLDVAGSNWYDLWVDLAYSTGLMQGTGNDMFEPLRTLTVAEALHLAACMESRALQDDFHLQSNPGAFWYSSSVTYCEAVGLISPDQFSQADYARPITRAEMADIFSTLTPVRSIKNLNDLNRVKSTIPDVKDGSLAADSIYLLYAKGILNGSDSTLTFRPNDSLTRAEAAAIVARITRPEHRITLW